jgi:hypothetical protein
MPAEAAEDGDSADSGVIGQMKLPSAIGRSE